jgi:hypothetical protein
MDDDSNKVEENKALEAIEETMDDDSKTLEEVTPKNEDTA